MTEELRITDEYLNGIPVTDFEGYIDPEPFDLDEMTLLTVDEEALNEPEDTEIDLTAGILYTI